MMQQQMQDLARLVDQKITDTHKVMRDTEAGLNKTIQQQFGTSIKIVTDVTEKLTKLDQKPAPQLRGGLLHLLSNFLVVTE